MSQKDGATETIDGEVYVVYMLPPRVARKILIDLSKVIGPALASLADSSGGLKSLMEKNVDQLGGILSVLVEKIDDSMMEDHMNKLAAVTQVGGVDLTKIFDIHFRGEIGKMFKWYLFALKANFGNFTSALASVSSNLTPVKAKE